MTIIAFKTAEDASAFTKKLHDKPQMFYRRISTLEIDFWWKYRATLQSAGWAEEEKDKCRTLDGLFDWLDGRDIDYTFKYGRTEP